MFTKYYGSVRYEISPGVFWDIPDLTRMAVILRKYKTADYSLDYTIKDGERIEQVAHKIYGTTSRWFLISMFNDMLDPLEEWPMDQIEFYAYLQEKYGNKNPSGIVHYVDPDGVIVDPFGQGFLQGISEDQAIYNNNLKPVTEFEYEFALNEAKKKIKILDPDVVGEVEQVLRGIYSDV
jgi:hypothetical protein